MIFLLNNERVLSEILELTKLKISESLGISESRVHVKVELEDGVVKPSFGIDDTDAVESQAQDAIREVWGQLRLELAARMKGLNSRRHGFGD